MCSFPQVSVSTANAGIIVYILTLLDVSDGIEGTTYDRDVE